MDIIHEINEFINLEINKSHNCSTEMQIAFILLKEAKKKIIQLEKEKLIEKTI